MSFTNTVIDRGMFGSGLAWEYGSWIATSATSGTISPATTVSGIADIMFSDVVSTGLGFEVLSDSFVLAACANTDSENADAASEPDAGHASAAFSTVAAGAFAVGAITAHAPIRNVCITLKNDSGNPLNLYAGVMTFTVTGTDYAGATKTEAITFTSNGGNKAIADGKFRYKYGVKAFKTITACTVDNICDNGLKIAVGLGSKVYLENVPINGVSGILDAWIGTTALVPASVYNATYQTIACGTVASASQGTVQYQTAEAEPIVKELTTSNSITIRCGYGAKGTYFLLGRSA